MDLKEGIIICNLKEKQRILENITDFKSYKFYTLSEFLKNLTLTYDKKALYYLNKELGISVNNLIEILNYLKYEQLFRDISHEKTDLLKKIILILENHKLITRNEQFIDIIKNKHITFLNVEDSFDFSFGCQILKSLGVEFECKKAEELTYKTRTVYAFVDLVDEVRFVFNRIKELLDGGMPLGKIKIANYSSDYDFAFKRMSMLYKIPFNFESDKNILQTKTAKDVLKLFKEHELKDAIIILEKDYQDYPFYEEVVSIINDYSLTSFDSTYAIKVFTYAFENLRYPSPKYKDAIEFIDLKEHIISKDEVIFIIGFNNSFIPYVHKDVLYFDDNLLNKLGMDNSEKRTQKEKELIKNKLNQNANYIISYKTNSVFNKYLKSPLIKELKYEETKVEPKIGYSKEEDYLLLTDVLDNYRKFKIKDHIFEENIRFKGEDFPYLDYDNQTEDLNEELVSQLIDFNKVYKFSFSSLDNYFKCSFKYYIENTLRLNYDDSHISSKIGTFIHEALALAYDLEYRIKDDVDYDRIFKDALANTEAKEQLEEKDKFIICSLFKLTKDVIDYNLRADKGYKAICEPDDFVVRVTDKYQIGGKIDKIVYQEEGNKTNLVITDYKVRSIVKNPNFNNLEYGLNLQLPIYAYLVAKSDKFTNPNVVGLYLQDVLKISELEKEPITMRGLDFSGNKLLVENYKVGRMPTMDSSDLEVVLRALEDNFKKAYSGITKGNIKISPKEIDGENVSCEYCSSRDICFKNYSNIEKLEARDFRSLLIGDAK